MIRPRAHVIKRGFDIRLAGGADPATRFQATEPQRVGATLGAIPGLHVRPLVRVDDRVRKGDPVLAYRDGARILVAAPASGVVTAILRGDERVSPCVEIARDSSASSESAELRLPKAREVGTIDREELAGQLRECGLWPLFRERPLGHTPLSGPPQAVFISGMDTEPLAAAPAVLMDGRDQDFKLGLAIVKRLSDGPVYLCISEADKALPLFALGDAEVHTFKGPHPAGLPGTHINRIAPLASGARYWTIRAQDVMRIGEAIRTRTFPSHRMVALAGPRAARPGYYRVHDGCPLNSFASASEGDSRILQGTILSGFTSADDDYLATTVHTVTIIGEGLKQRRLFGWLLPHFNHPSASRASFGWLRRRSSYPIDARLNGEARPIVNIGSWDKVMPLDVHVSSIVRAIQAGDIEEALTLGLLDLTEEDVALCSYTDPCKLDVGAVIRRGLEQYASEQGGE